MSYRELLDSRKMTVWSWSRPLTVFKSKKPLTFTTPSSYHRFYVPCPFEMSASPTAPGTQLIQRIRRHLRPGLLIRLGGVPPEEPILQTPHDPEQGESRLPHLIGVAHGGFIGDHPSLCPFNQPVSHSFVLPRISRQSRVVGNRTPRRRFP